jgi:GNAT superfamily N-acetyltransferase
MFGTTFRCGAPIDGRPLTCSARGSSTDVLRTRVVFRAVRDALRQDVLMGDAEPAILVVPANEASWEELRKVFGERGEASRCQCQRYKLGPGESFASFPTEERADRLRQQADCGHPGSGTTSGLVAYLDGEPVGWCSVEPRTAYPGLLRNHRLPWVGRAEDKTDDSVWAVTCLLTRAGFRRRGVSRALARAAVDFAREGGARALEAYPITTRNVIDQELHVGTESVFADAGLTEVSRPSPRRAVRRIDFPIPEEPAGR